MYASKTCRLEAALCLGRPKVHFFRRLSEVRYNSFHRIVLPLCSDTMHAQPQTALSAGSPSACPHGGSRCGAFVAVSQRRDGVAAAEDFAQYQLRFGDDIQHDYEVIRPIGLCAETIAERSRKTGIEPTVVGAKARRF